MHTWLVFIQLIISTDKEKIFSDKKIKFTDTSYWQDKNISTDKIFYIIIMCIMWKIEKPNYIYLSFVD